MLNEIRGNEDYEEDIKRIKQEARLAVLEYFNTQEAEEALFRINSITVNFYHYEIVKVLLNLAMDKDSKSRELASQLIGETGYFNQVSVRRGLEILVSRLEDLQKDIPDATTMLSCFIARAIVDEAIPPSFIQEVAFQPLGTSPHAIQCLQKVQHLLSMKLSAQRLSKIWGPGRGHSVSELKEKISLMLNEFFFSKDLNELANSIKEMNEPNFHHELVKQSVLKAAEKGQEAVDGAIGMLRSFVTKEIVSVYQVKIGLQRVENGLGNYSCDLPALPNAFQRFQDELRDLLEPEEEVEEEVLAQHSEV